MPRLRNTLLWGKRVARLIVLLGTHPGQVKYLPRWAKSLRSSPLSLRLPWLPYDAIAAIGAEMPETGTVFEFGGGGSTLWFSDRAANVHTVEHDQEWFEILRDTAGAQDHVSVRFGSPDDNYKSYIAAIDSLPDGSVDVVVVDGRERVRCLQAALPKVAPGGLLVLDDSNRPRYKDAHLAAPWGAQTFVGLAPSKIDIATTTIWRRPSD